MKNKRMPGYTSSTVVRNIRCSPTKDEEAGCYELLAAIMRQALHDISTPKLRAKYWKDVTKFLKSLSHGELYLQKAIEYGKIKEIQYLGDWKYRNVK